MNGKLLKEHCERMCKAYERAPTSNTYLEHKFVLDLLNQAEWIPVSEGLPKLVNDIGTKKYPLMVSKPVHISYRIDGRDYVCPIPCVLDSYGNWSLDRSSIEDWVNLDDYDSGTEDPLHLEVTAWKPLMEPYKEGEE